MPSAAPESELRPDRASLLRDKLQAPRISRGLVHLALILVVSLGGYVGVCSAVLVSYRWLDPPVTGVQAQRRIEAVLIGQSYERQYSPRPAIAISDHILNAVVAAEDNRFFLHRGLDWTAIETAFREGRGRGGSTISQQLAKNLFLTTHRSYLRKAVEVPLTLLLEVVLSKDRILELYVNVVEWAGGVYGAEAATRHYFGRSSDRVSRRQAAALASCLPNPRRRRPHLDGWYTNVILRRMNQMGF